jgi:hypothetical protein
MIQKEEYLSNVREEIVQLLNYNKIITWDDYLAFHPANSYEKGILINQLNLDGLLKYMKINIDNNSSVANYYYLFDINSRKTYDDEMNNFLLPLLLKKLENEQ